MRKWFWLYLTCNVGLVAYFLYISLYLIDHLMNRLMLDLGGKEYLAFSLGPFIFSQGSNFAERRIKKIVSEGAEVAQSEMHWWWFRAFDRINSVLWVPILLLLIAFGILTWKGWFAP